jgi:DNA-binding transcriptional MerR regulator
MLRLMHTPSHNDLYTVSELAGELGTTPRALRFYEDKKLVAPRRVGNARVYTRRDRGRLVLILRGKRLGFTLREIRDWLDLYDMDPGQVEQMKTLAVKVGERIASLEMQRGDIDETITELRTIAAETERYLADGGQTERSKP